MKTENNKPELTEKQKKGLKILENTDSIVCFIAFIGILLIPVGLITWLFNIIGWKILVIGIVLFIFFGFLHKTFKELIIEYKTKYKK